MPPEWWLPTLGGPPGRGASDGQGRLDHRRHRPGWRLSGRAAAGEGLRGPRHQAPLVLVQHRPDRPSLPGSARAGPALRPALWRHDRRHQPDPHRAGGAARRDLQPRRAEPRAGQLRDARIHRQRRRARHAAPARGDPHPRPRRQDALLPGLHLRALRHGAGSAAERDDAVLPALALMPRPSSTPTGSR